MTSIPLFIMLAQGGPWGGATLKQLYLELDDMEIDDNIPVEYKLDYLKLSLKISKIRLQGNEPPKELLQQARELGRLANISEDELKNL